MSATGRNDPCPCGSGKRYKHCHGAIAGNKPGTPIVSTHGGDVARTLASALAAHQRGDLDQAELGYRAALDLAPANSTATHYLGVTLYQRGRLDEALPLLRAAADMTPGEPEFHNNLGLVLAAMGREEEAIAAYRLALAHKPDHATAWNNLGLALQETNALEQAIEAFRNAVSLNAGFAQARWNLALALLANGEYAEGWREYESRLELPELGGRLPRRDGPRWEGSDVLGKTVLVVAEQGLGDTLQFIRFAQALAGRGARVIVEVQPPLVNLAASAPGVIATFAAGSPLPPYDFHVALLSLPQRLGIDETSIVRPPYMRVDADRKAAAARAIARIAEGRFSVGVAWAGTRQHAFARRRSLEFAFLLSLFDIPGIAWFSLQKGDGADDFRGTPAATRLIPLDQQHTFDDTAALVDSLDLIITVDTSIAHLAGALARPVWIMLPFAAAWRWRNRSTETPWYPTARLFRQATPGDWANVIASVGDALSARVREH